MSGLWKTTIVIWSDFDSHQYEINKLAQEAVDGDAYCSSAQHTYVTNPAADSDWDGTDFFAERAETNA